MPGGTHEFAAQKKAYAEFAKLKPRTAQLHAQKGHPDWLAFLESQGVGGAKEVHMEVAAPELFSTAVSSEPSGEKAPKEIGGSEEIEDRMLRSHRELWEEAVESAKRCTKKGDPISAAQFSKLAHMHMISYEKAKLSADKAAVVRRTMIPGSEWSDLLEMVGRIASLVTGIDRELADKCNPENPSVAALAIRNWLDHRWNPAVAAVQAQFA